MNNEPRHTERLTGPSRRKVGLETPIVGRFIGEDIVRAASATINMSELDQVKWESQQKETAAAMLGRHGIEYHAAVKAVNGMLESARVEASVATFAKTSAASFFRLAVLARDRGLIK